MGRKKLYSVKLAEWAQRRAEIVQLHAAGMTYATIGKNYRISKQRVQQIVARQAA